MSSASAPVPPQASPEPLATFDALPLSAEVRKAVDDLGYVHPTPVQRAVFEAAAEGADLVVQARTGTGKTAAFGLPLVDRLVKAQLAKPQVLVLSPTRELALQITRELTALSKYRGTRIAAVYGGAPMQRQIDEIHDGAQIVVGTPGRVLDHLSRRTLDPSTLKVIVLDESDEMLSMGFLPQINAILSQLPEAHQTLLFSATVPPDVRRMAETRLVQPRFITLSGDHIGALEIQHFVYLSHADKATELVKIIEIENPESAIVFCNTRDQTKRVANALQQQGFSADWLNADLAQSDREKVMAATREGKLRFLVATDVAARGIDISHLTHVINADFPESTENYVHRTGRTGRAGRTGTAISLVTPQDIGNLYMLKLTYKIFPIERELPTAREERSRQEADLVGMFASAFGSRRAHPADLSLARRLLSHDSAEIIVAGLLRDHLGARPETQDSAAALRRTRPPRSVQEPSDKGGNGRAHERPPLGDKEGVQRLEEGEERRPAEEDFDAAEGREGKKRKKDKRKKKRAREQDAGPVAQGAQEQGAQEPWTQEPWTEPGAELVENGQQPGESEEEPQYSGQTDTEQLFTEASSDADEGLVRIFVNVGRRHGVRREDINEILEEQGFEEEDVGFVKVRERHTFVGVPTDLETRALLALDGARIRGRTVQAEKARIQGPDE